MAQQHCNTMQSAVEAFSQATLRLKNPICSLLEHDENAWRKWALIKGRDNLPAAVKFEWEAKSIGSLRRLLRLIFETQPNHPPLYWCFDGANNADYASAAIQRLQSRQRAKHIATMQAAILGAETQRQPQNVITKQKKELTKYKTASTDKHTKWREFVAWFVADKRDTGWTLAAYVDAIVAENAAGTLIQRMAGKVVNLEDDGDRTGDDWYTEPKRDASLGPLLEAFLKNRALERESLKAKQHISAGKPAAEFLLVSSVRKSKKRKAAVAAAEDAAAEDAVAAEAVAAALAKPVAADAGPAAAQQPGLLAQMSSLFGMSPSPTKRSRT